METMWIERLTQVDGAWVWKAEQETFNLQADFAMSETELNSEICRMGQLLVKYGSVAGDQDANLKRKEEHAKLVQAQVAGALRSQAEASGVKMTENKLMEQVTAHPLYQEALNEMHILRADAIKATNWWKSILKKADLLNALAYRQTAELKRMPG